MESETSTLSIEISQYVDECQCAMSNIFSQAKGLFDDFDKLGEEMQVYQNITNDGMPLTQYLINRQNKAAGLVTTNQPADEKGSSNIAMKFIKRTAQAIKDYSGKAVTKALGDDDNGTRNERIARENYESVLTMQQRCYEYMEILARFYDQNNVEISMQDAQLEEKVITFQCIFLLWMRVSYLEKLANFVTDTFNSWLEGGNGSSLPKPNMYALIGNLRNQTLENEEWDKIWLQLCMLKPSDTCRMDKLLYLVDPYLFSSFIGCIWGYNSTLTQQTGIRMFPNDRYIKRDKLYPGLSLERVSEASRKLLDLNPFYQKCVQLSHQKPLIRFPKLGLMDFLGEFIPPLLIIGLGYAAWIYTFSWTLLCCILGLAVLFVLLEYLWHHGFMPHTFKYRQKRYKKQLYTLEQEYEALIRLYPFGVLAKRG